VSLSVGDLFQETVATAPNDGSRPLPPGQPHLDAPTGTSRLVAEIRPHPRILQHCLSPATAKLSALADRGDLAFQDPLMVTAEGIILDGFARWTLARLKGYTMLPCMVRHLDESEALVYILQKQRQSVGLNDFIRISLALELEPNFRAQARERQRLGGEKKLSSNLTGAQRIDVRARIAETASVCVANVTKVKRLIESADVTVLTALRVGEIRIHRAWTWLESSKDGGLQDYKNFCNETGMRRMVKTLIARQVARRPSAPDDLNELRKALCELSSKPRFKGLVRSIESLLQAFDAQITNGPVHNVAA
jgi:hypothetical protein